MNILEKKSFFDNAIILVLYPSTLDQIPAKLNIIIFTSRIISVYKIKTNRIIKQFEHCFGKQRFKDISNA